MGTIVTFGEIMLRLKSPGFERLFQSPVLEATFGGAEANVAVAMSSFGKRASFVSLVPNTPAGDAAVRELKKHGVDTSHVSRRNSGRLGIFFLESGASQRASAVTYDREGSCIAGARPEDFDWDGVFAGAGWFHVSGITPALSACAAETALAAVLAAKKQGIPVSIDLNYRKKLWNYGKEAPAVMKEFVALADVLVANEEDIQLSLGIGAEGAVPTNGAVPAQAYKTLAETVRSSFPNLMAVAITLRESISADRNGWSAILSGTSGFRVSKTYEIDDIVDRVGAGDAFAAGLIYGLMEYGTDEQRALDFAAASGCLKHSVPGDFALISVAEVEALLSGDGSGRVRR